MARASSTSPSPRQLVYLPLSRLANTSCCKGGRQRAVTVSPPTSFRTGTQPARGLPELGTPCILHVELVEDRQSCLSGSRVEFLPRSCAHLRTPPSPPPPAVEAVTAVTALQPLRRRTGGAEYRFAARSGQAGLPVLHHAASERINACVARQRHWPPASSRGNASPRTPARVAGGRSRPQVFFTRLSPATRAGIKGTLVPPAGSRGLLSSACYARARTTFGRAGNTRSGWPRVRHGWQHVRHGRQHVRHDWQHVRQGWPHVRQGWPHVRHGWPHVRQGWQHVRQGWQHV